MIVRRAGIKRVDPHKAFHSDQSHHEIAMGFSLTSVSLLFYWNNSNFPSVHQCHLAYRSKLHSNKSSLQQVCITSLHNLTLNVEITDMILPGWQWPSLTCGLLTMLTLRRLITSNYLMLMLSDSLTITIKTIAGQQQLHPHSFSLHLLLGNPWNNSDLQHHSQIWQT